MLVGAYPHQPQTNQLKRLILITVGQYIFCGTCSRYKAVVENLGPTQVRVCEVDYYRLNPDIKPQTAAALERIAQFSESVSF
ncbi:hypothetical protein ACTXT7_008635 [Hymenolepis weldensis]